jgi:hypothetical protein
MEQFHGLEDGTLVRLRQGATRITCYVEPDVQAPTKFRAYRDAEKQQSADLNGISCGAFVERLNAEDWAVVAGINYYPALTDLEGPKLDSATFEEWVKNSGFVPDEQVICLRSPAYRPECPGSAQPTQADFEEAFRLLIRKAYSKQFHRLGRRLYIFFSGHGIIATRASIPDWREAALLMANAEPIFLSNHVGARAWAEWFRALAIFDEVFLFADCCRDLEDLVAPNPIGAPPWKRERREEGRGFYAFSTRLGRSAWEQPLGSPPQVRGILSFVLNQALKNPKLYNDEGLLTGSALSNHLYSTFPGYTQKQSPVIEYENNPILPELIIAKWAPRAKQTVQFEFNPVIPGARADLFAGNNTNKPMASHLIDRSTWIQELDAGSLYKISIQDTDRKSFFETSAIDEVQVVTV